MGNIIASIGLKVQGAVITSSGLDTRDHAHHGIAQFMKKEGEKEMSGEQKAPVENVRELIERACAEFCDKYCKWPDLFDEEAEGCPLEDSEHCRNCPTQRLC